MLSFHYSIIILIVSKENINYFDSNFINQELRFEVHPIVNNLNFGFIITEILILFISPFSYYLIIMIGFILRLTIRY